MRLIVPSILLLLTLLLPGCAGLHEQPASISTLMVQRLDWMDDVAEAKRAKGLPTNDPKREAELLRSMTQRGVSAGLKAENVRRFFTGQMQAAKVRQEEWLLQHPTATTAHPPALATTIRPALDQIGTKMIEQLAQETRWIIPVEAAILVTKARKQLIHAGYSEAVIKPALMGLQGALNMDAIP